MPSTVEPRSLALPVPIDLYQAALYNQPLLIAMHTLYMSSGLAGSKYFHWLGGAGVSRLSHLMISTRPSQNTLTRFVDLRLPLEHLASQRLFRFSFFQDNLRH